MSNLERIAMLGKQAELKAKQARLRNRIMGDATAIRQRLNTVLTPPDELPVPELDEQWDQLKAAWAELITVNADLERIGKELG